MSDRYYRKRIKDVKNSDSINDLTNIVLDQRKIKYLENNINLKNISRYNLKDNIYIRFDKDSKNTFNIINIPLKNLKKDDIIEINFNMINTIKFHANHLIMLYTNYELSNNEKNILVCSFDLDDNIYRNKIINNNVIFEVDKNYDIIDLKINFYLDKSQLKETDFVELNYYKILGNIIIKHYSKLFKIINHINI